MCYSCPFERPIRLSSRYVQKALVIYKHLGLSIAKIVLTFENVYSAFCEPTPEMKTLFYIMEQLSTEARIIKLYKVGSYK